MKLAIFQEKNKKKTGMIMVTVVVILLFTAILFYRTYSIYQEQQGFDVIKGNVPDQNWDVMFSFFLEDESGNTIISNTIPDGKDYNVSITCNNDANGEWNYELWGPKITNLTNARTKCHILFQKYKRLIDVMKEIKIVQSGNGLYRVDHNDAIINYTTNATEISNLKQTEYRYAGDNPNNYVKFNDEVWRILGLVNTPEGSRVKIIRNDSLGSYSWDASESNINLGKGINEYSVSKVNLLLNDFYYNRKKDICYQLGNAVDCNFQNYGLTDITKQMIDNVTWNTGSNGQNSYSYVTVPQFYNYERSGDNAKICSSSDLCNDSVARTVIWRGQIGLMYPSDYGYATSGGSTNSRDTCLNSDLIHWNTVKDCRNYNWLTKEDDGWWSMTPNANMSNAGHIFGILNNGVVSNYYAYNSMAIYPTLYLKIDVKTSKGVGTIEDPYLLKM